MLSVMQPCWSFHSLDSRVVIRRKGPHNKLFAFPATKNDEDFSNDDSSSMKQHTMDENDNHDDRVQFQNKRREFLSAILLSTATMTAPDPSTAAFPTTIRPNRFSLSVLAAKNSTAASSIRRFDYSNIADPDLAMEVLLLRLLPIKNTVFRNIEANLLAISDAKTANISNPSDKSQVLRVIAANMENTIQYLDAQRLNLEPVFNQDDTTEIYISKATRGEFIAEELRNDLKRIQLAATQGDSQKVKEYQKQALRTLADFGELLVYSYPYNVPSEGKFSYIPRLLGRTKVTFTIVRPKKKRSVGSLTSSSSKDVLLGNVTILADGYAAPITAGNFVDLSLRGFYTQLPVKSMKKVFGSNPVLTNANDLVSYDIAQTVEKIRNELREVATEFSTTATSSSSTGTEKGTIQTTLPILGSFGEGFYDPLTAKPRRIPLEIVQYDKMFARAKLSYESGFSRSNSIPTTTGLASVLNPSAKDDSEYQMKISSPLLTFDIPGLVAMNHPDKNLNGGSSEFFTLPLKDLKNQGETKLMDGQYTPFGYVLDGLDIMQNLQNGDLITATYVDDFGQLYLKKIRGSTFSDALNSGGNEEEEKKEEES
jgi:cyclophilin family peptidyl-prolyl cis-trans isomerase